MNGRVLEEFSAFSRGTTMMLDVSLFSSGNYQLTLRSRGQILQTEKIIIN